MTAQCRERLIYNGEEYYLATEPLAPYLVSHKIRFTAPHTACWRGYIGSWLIEDNKLYLVDLEANISDGDRKFGEDKEVGLVYGVESAPIVIKNYTSFQCPDCSELHLKLHDVLKKYIDNGDVKYIEKQIDIERFQFDDLIYKKMNDEQINDFEKLSEIYEKQSQWIAYENDEDVIKLLNLKEDDNKNNNANTFLYITI